MEVVATVFGLLHSLKVNTLELIQGRIQLNMNVLKRQVKYRRYCIGIKTLHLKSCSWHPDRINQSPSENNLWDAISSLLSEYLTLNEKKNTLWGKYKMKRGKNEVTYFLLYFFSLPSGAPPVVIAPGSHRSCHESRDHPKTEGPKFWSDWEHKQFPQPLCPETH